MGGAEPSKRQIHKVGQRHQNTFSKEKINTVHRRGRAIKTPSPKNKNINKEVIHHTNSANINEKDN